MAATRFYTPATGAVAATPAFDGAWDESGAAVRRPLVLTPTNTISTDFVVQRTVFTLPDDALVLQYVSNDTLPAGSISGTFSAVVVTTESSTSNDHYMQMVVRVVSGDGSVIRGTLLAAQTATSVVGTVGAVNEEMSTNVRTRIYNALALTPVVAVAGDRIVVDLGYRACAGTSGIRNTTIKVTDSTTATDYALTSGLNDATKRGWMEFSQDLFNPPFAPPNTPINLAITNIQPTALTLNWQDGGGGPTTSYEVRINGGTPINVGNVLAHQFTGLSPSTVYLMEVRALGPGGTSGWASLSAITAPAPSGGGGSGGPTSCACGEDWVIHACDLRTGIIKAVLHPTAFDFETIRNRLGRGTLTLVTREVTPAQIWPHLTSIYISRRKDDGTFEGLFGGMSEAGQANSSTDGGTTAVGMQPIEEYLHHRMLRTDLTFTGVSQTEIAKALVEAVAGNGIAISAVAAPSAFTRDRAYLAADRPFVGPALEELSNVPDGIDWQVTYVRSGGTWQTVIQFADRVGGPTDVILKSDREGAQYGLDLDAKDHATLIDAIGSGGIIATAIDTSGIYPQFDAAPQFSDETDPSVLQEDADGYLLGHREPTAVPSIDIAGGDPTPTELRLGDEVTADIDHGGIVYRGPARVDAIAWRKTADTPDTRTIGLTPLTRASESVYGQVPSDPCTDC